LWFSFLRYFKRIVLPSNCSQKPDSIEQIFLYLGTCMNKKVAMIAGASGGLGQALAQHLAPEYTLVLVGRDLNRLEALYGNAHILLPIEAYTAESARALLAACQAKTGALPERYAHCVGNIRLGAIHRMSEADFKECLDANLMSAWVMLQALMTGWREQSIAGSAVFVSSAAARIGTPNHEAIALAKGGLEALIKSAAATYSPYGIRLNVVAPGLMDTPAASRLISTDAARQIAAKQYPLPAGIGDPDDVADLMAWLLSDRAQRVTGQVWSIDGGFSAIRPTVK
jgi:NAD(P)-dependent dehydrogenase (short-subunit alcohol dehydrogenase family)